MYAPHLDSGVEKIMVWYSFSGGRWTWGAWAKIARGTQQVQVQRGVGSSYFALSSWPCTTQVCDLIKDKKTWQLVYSCFVQKSDFLYKLCNFSSASVFCYSPRNLINILCMDLFKLFLLFSNEEIRILFGKTSFFANQEEEKEEKGIYVFWTEVVAGR